jgi:hypothetical protein
MKKTTKILLIFASILLLAVFACPVNARGGVFVIQPHQEAIESLPNYFDNSADNAAGNVSSDGFIDFYILSPNGTILQCYNRTAFVEFKVFPNTEGICTLHMANNYESSNVTVNLQYGINLFIYAKETITCTSSVSTSSFIATIPEQPFDWSTVVALIKSIIGFLSALEIVNKAKGWIRNSLWKIRWWLKHRKNRTPSDILNSSSQFP